MASRFFFRLVRFIALAAIVIALTIFLGSLVAEIIVGMNGSFLPGKPNYFYDHRAEINGTVYYMTRKHAEMLALAKRGIWTGILTAFGLALLYSFGRTLRSRKAG